MRTRAIFLPAAVLVAASSPAQLVWYGTRSGWDAARPATLAWAEDFSGFTSDRQFRTQAVAFAGGTLRQTGFNLNFRNIVDVPALATPDNNGTANASMFTNHGGPGQREAGVTMSLSAAVTALGFATWGAASSEGVTVSVYSGSTLLGSRAIGNGNGEFTGFVLGPGQTADRLTFSSTTLVPGNAGEGFGLDDVSATTQPVPEPGALLGVGVALVGLSWRRRR
jgi:hypothetical protein